MEPATDPVVLNIYELIPDQQQAGSDGSGSGNSAQPVVSPGVSSFFSKILTPMGFGAYHTSLDVRGYCYTFAAGSGIRKTQSSNKAIHVPPNGEFKESIELGSCILDVGRINEVVNRLRQKYFTDTSYHLLNRNCNHFTETFATALILADRLADQNPPNLRSYPKWVNRLAKSSTSLIDHGDVCDVVREARNAAGMDDKVGWDLPSSSSKERASSGTAGDGRSRSKKKELTEAQKAALAKLTKNKV